jgi:hypothetical protein
MRAAEIIETVMRALPCCDQVRGLHIVRDEVKEHEEDALVRFTWRGDTLSVSSDLRVEQVQGSMCATSNLAILFEALLRRAFLSKD